jgi:hypothetical protein
LLFGIGSMIGMGVLSCVIAVRIAISARWWGFAKSPAAGAVDLIAIAIGLHAIVSTTFT